MAHGMPQAPREGARSTPGRDRIGRGTTDVFPVPAVVPIRRDRRYLRLQAHSPSWPSTTRRAPGTRPGPCRVCSPRAPHPFRRCVEATPLPHPPPPARTSSCDHGRGCTGWSRLHRVVPAAQGPDAREAGPADGTGLSPHRHGIWEGVPPGGFEPPPLPPEGNLSTSSWADAPLGTRKYRRVGSPRSV
jgi:hypothetical protein